MLPKRRRIAAIILTALPGPALAHHGMDDATPGTLGEGIMSGFAHPVLGLDHLAFLLAAGLLASAAPRLGYRALAAFLTAGIAGALLHRAAIGLGPVEIGVAVSVLAAGGLLLALGRRTAIIASALAVPGFALAGLFHGHAFAEAVAESPAAVFIAHLAALTLAQAMITGAALLAARAVAGFGNLPFRAAGLGATAVGAFALVTAIGG
ncbi:urease accessory protein UreJ [Roseomonas hellenica]|uniref:Urease accessory protein UreJ n=1 Tax=Plastoroseomonas hellenica TaxID=2687306 RepID=A0ABS5EW46_9PROT|nr:HupE/UreJ family protein [Plastoroseomonas hellenica]MBR0664517.1 urease accessory protein UreJ [Plastoroseomonas hellenica]